MSRIIADMIDKVSELCPSLFKSSRRNGSRLALFLLLISIISALALAPTCAAQSGYEIRNAIVSPEYGNEDFTYSAEVWMSDQAAAEVGALAVTQFSLKLNIYNDGKLVHSDSSDQRGMGKSSFVFGPYNFKNRFGISETENATFEFVFYSAGSQVAKTKRLLGPIVKPPNLTGTPLFDRTPYFFQGLSVSAGFRDMDGLDPKPTCHLVISGPIGKSESRIWETADVSCRSSGNSAYTCTLNEDLSQYRDGGNFSFKVVYNNLKVQPLSFGPYNITLRPYTPTADSLKIDRNLDYTNFTISATVKDASAKLEESLPQGRLIISRPGKAEVAYVSTEPEILGEKAVFKWTNENEPALFNRSDVDLSKVAPFSARLEYTNERWNLSAMSPTASFNVVEEVPKLINPSIPENVYVSSGEISAQEMAVTVAYSKGPGDLDVRLTGPSMDYESTNAPTPLGGNKYQYRWQVEFDDSHVNNNYTLSMSFVHDQVEGGRYDFDDRTIHVSPVSVRFLQASVDSTAGWWNDSYTYSLKMDTTVPVKVQLQVYDPCSSDWIKKQTKDVAAGTASAINWTLQPFAYDCQEMAGQNAKYRFKAIFSGEEIASSRAYDGPSFLGAKPVLVSISPQSNPMVVYVSDEGASSSVSAIVEYAAGQGQAAIRLEEPDGTLKVDEQSRGVALGANRYRYDWSLPFDLADADKSFNLSLSYSHATLSSEYPLAERTVVVQPVSIKFGEEGASVSPNKGRWNDTFVYSVPVASTVDAAVKLQVYNPCSHTWAERASGKAIAGETLLNMTAKPFKSKCADSEGDVAIYRFVASFEDNAFESDVHYGPSISGGKPELISVDYNPVLHVSVNSPAYQSVKAIVDLPQGQDAIEITTVGPNKSPVTEEMNGVYLGATRYLFTWSKEYGKDDVGNYTLDIKNVHPQTSGGEITFSGTMAVVLDEASSGLEPKAIGDVSYLPVLFVTAEKGASQAFFAEVYSPGGKGTMTLNLTGVGKSRAVEMSATEMGANRYRYDYAEPFDASNAGNNYMFSLDYQLDGKRYALFDDHIMQVALEGTEPEPIWEPKLILEYDTTLYVPAGGKADQLIHATINYTESGGILKLNLTGPSKNLTESLSDRAIGVDRYLYEADIPFDENDIGNSFTISLAFNHTSLAGGDYRFADHYMRVLKKAPLSQQGSSGAGDSGQGNRVFDNSTVTVIGNVTPAVGVIQAWDEKDPLHALTYTLQLLNWSSKQVPWIELSVRPFGSDSPWKIVGDKKRYNPTTGSVSWTLKPFWETPFFGLAEYRFLIDGAETEAFKGPEIVAVVSDAADSISGKIHYFEATVNASENLTVCMVGGDSSLPENIKVWTTEGQCQYYQADSGDQTYKWQTAVAQAPPYYDFDIQIRDEESIK